MVLGRGRDIEIQNKHHLTTEATHAQRLHQLVLLFRTLHAQETDGLLGAFVHGRENVQARDASEFTAQLMQG